MGLTSISIITATYNQGHFIQETFDSIKAQKYDALEYIVLDGESEDGTVDIIKQNEHLITNWSSQKDAGAADAILKGFKMSSGKLINWLNSDDILLPNTLNALNVIANKYPNYDVYAFMGMSMGINGGFEAVARRWKINNLDIFFQHFSFAQESTFLKKEFLDQNNVSIDERLINTFDSKLYMDMLNKNPRILFIETYGGIIRHHLDAKTSKGIPKSDKLILKEQVTNTTLLFKFLRRIYISRFSFLFVFLNNKFGLGIISRITRKQLTRYNICNFIDVDIYSPNSWHIRK